MQWWEMAAKMTPLDRKALRKELGTWADDVPTVLPHGTVRALLDLADALEARAAGLQRRVDAYEEGYEEVEGVLDAVTECLPAYCQEAAGGGTDLCNAVECVEQAGADLARLESEVTRLRASLAEAREALEKYGQHTDLCPVEDWRFHGDYYCITSKGPEYVPKPPRPQCDPQWCGLDAAISKLEVE